jgi:hypothetical protein
VGDQVVYTSTWVGATVFFVCTIVRLLPGNPHKADKVELDLVKASIKEAWGGQKKPLVYASNVMKYEEQS